MIDQEEVDEQRLKAEKALRDSYKAAFAGGSGQRALEDLRRFCRADSTCLAVGPNGIDIHATLVAEGRREVWLRVANALKIDPHTGQAL